MVDPYAGVGKKRRLAGPSPNEILDQLWTIIDAGGLRDDPKVKALYDAHVGHKAREHKTIDEDSEMREASPELHQEASGPSISHTAASIASPSVSSPSVPDASGSTSGRPVAAPASTPFVDFLPPTSCPAEMPSYPAPGPSSSVPQDTPKSKKTSPRVPKVGDDDGLYALPDEVFDGQDSDLEISGGVDPADYLSDESDDDMDGLEIGAVS